MKKNNIQLVHETEITNKYDLSELFMYWRDVYDRDIQNYYVLFSEGDMHLETSLFLDWENKWSTQANKWLQQVFGIQANFEKDNGIAALIVLGNLYINGSVVNEDGDSGPALFVQGNLQAHNLIAGGSCICINGNADIEECTSGYYNGGILCIQGTLTTTVCIDEYHHFETGTKKVVAGFSRDEECLQEDENGDNLVPEVLKKLLRKDIVLWEDMQDNLRIGKYILLDSKHVDNKKELNQEYYNQLVNAIIEHQKFPVYDMLKRVPAKFRIKELCEKSVAIHPYNLSYTPKKFVTYEMCCKAVQHPEASPNLTEAIPAEHRTRELCMLAAKHKAISIKDLPKSFLQDEELLVEIIKNFSYAYVALPDELKLQQPYMKAAIDAGGREYVESAKKYLR